MPSPAPIAELPILVASARVMPGDQESARGAGANGFLAKPLRPRLLGDTSGTRLRAAAAFLSATNAVLPELEDDLLALQQLEEDALSASKDILGFED